MGIFSEIPPGQSSDDWGPLTLQCMGESYLVRPSTHHERVNSVVPLIRLPVPCVVSVANEPILQPNEDDMYRIAKECSHGWSQRQAGAPAAVVSSLAMRQSVVHTLWTTRPTSSHCALGRPVGKRLYAYTLVHSYLSHTTASTCCMATPVAMWNHSLHPRPLDSEISSIRCIAR